MATPSVAQYTLSRLSQLGIDRIFGVPGDYAFAIDDAVENVPSLSWVACANELNAAYAADARKRANIQMCQIIRTHLRYEDVAL